MKIYLSSTLSDLGPERQAVKDALAGECVIVESYSADERSLRDACLSDVAACDLYIGIVGLRYGFIPGGQTQSITHLEYEEARRSGLSRWVFVKDESAIAYTATDAGTKEHPPEPIESFRRLVNSGAEQASRGAFFKTAEDLKSLVLKAYVGLARRRAIPKAKLIQGRPYPGLRAFNAGEADRFFGRDAEITELIERLIAKDERFLALIGASGSGKSSLVHAGLIPALTANPTVGGTHWSAIIFSPRKLSDDPFQPLAAALAEKFPDRGWRVSNLTASLRAHPASIATVAKEALGNDAPRGQLLVFVDQFEELFASKVDDGSRDAFFQFLAAATKCQLLRVLIAMRSDFYNHWPQDETYIALLRTGHFPVGVPGLSALEKMIVGPAQAAALTIAPRLVQRILDDTGSAPGALALAEFALAQLYERRSDGNALTETAYEAIGGVGGAINGLAEESLRKAGVQADEDTLSRLFIAIASVEERGQELVVVRRRAAQSELPTAARTLAQQLVDDRLLVSAEGTTPEGAIYEVGHEAVFANWARFKSWYDQYANDLVLRRQAERAAADWERAGCPPALLWGWERQRPVLEGLLKLTLLHLPACDMDFADEGIGAWRLLERNQREPSLTSFLRPEPLSLLEELESDDTPHHRREEIGLRLHQIGDPRRGVGLDDAGLPDTVWIDIAAGEVTLEHAIKDKFQVNPFRLSRYPVTWTQYRAFLNAPDGYRNSAWWEGGPKRDESGRPLWAFDNYPVVNVSWYDALAYCRWLGDKLRLDIRLPTEWEWQWAAVRDTQQEFPWPGGWNSARTNSVEAGIGRTVAVGLYPRGRASFGVDDMAGNVWEWAAGALKHPTNIRGVLAKRNASRVLRGGSWNSFPTLCRAGNRDGADPGSRSYDVGFRLCCASPIA